MAQFDVHANPGTRRSEVPYVMLVQSALFDHYRRRVVVPLVRRQLLPASGQSAGTRLNPVFEVQGEPLVLHPLDMVSVDLRQLGAKMGTLAQSGQQITDALDELLTRSWG